jgi:hypothetical protein
VRRRLLLLNLVLLAMVAAAAWQVRARWLAGTEQERALLRPKSKAVLPVEAEPGRLPQPASAAAYAEVAQQLLFAQDRNPNVTVEAAPPKPVPAFPVAYGMIDMGEGPLVILSAKPGAANHAYSAGEKIGEFTLASIENDEIVFDWEGQRIRKKLQDLKPQPGTAAPANPADTASAAQPAPATTLVQSVGSSANEGPGEQLTGDLKSCQPADTSPAGTVRDGYRKVVNRTPFGMACHWEPVK